MALRVLSKRLLSCQFATFGRNAQVFSQCSLFTAEKSRNESRLQCNPHLFTIARCYSTQQVIPRFDKEGPQKKYHDRMHQLIASKDYGNVAQILQQMTTDKVKPTLETYEIIMGVCERTGDHKVARTIVQTIHKSDKQPTTEIYLLYIKTLIRAKKRDEALSYFRALVKYVKEKPKSQKSVDLTRLYLEVISIFATNGFASQATEFQSEIDERTLGPREQLANSVNKMLIGASRGDVQGVQGLWNEIVEQLSTTHERHTIIRACEALISVYLHQGKVQEALQSFELATELLSKQTSSARVLRIMTQVLMKHLAERGEYQVCAVIAQRFKETNVWRPEHYHFLLRAYSRSPEPAVETAFALLNEMKAVCQPQIMTHNCILHVYARNRLAKEAFEYRDKLVKEGVVLDRATYNILLNIAVTSGDFNEALKIFEEIQAQNYAEVVNYATMFKLFYKARNTRTTDSAKERLRTVLLGLQEDMTKRGISHTHVSFITLLRALNDQRLYTEVIAIYSKHFESGNPPPFPLDSTIVDLALKAARSSENDEMFYRLLDMLFNGPVNDPKTTLRPSVYTFNIAIDACKDDIEKAKNLLEKMLSPPYSLTPDLVTLNTLLAVCRNGKRPDVALSVCKNMFARYRVQPDTLTFTILLQLKDDFAYFESVFEEMQQRKIALDHRLFNLVVAELVAHHQVDKLEKFLQTVTQSFGLDQPVRESVERAKIAPYIKQMLFEPQYLPHLARKTAEELFKAKVAKSPPA